MSESFFEARQFSIDTAPASASMSRINPSYIRNNNTLAPKFQVEAELSPLDTVPPLQGTSNKNAVFSNFQINRPDKPNPSSFSQDNFPVLRLNLDDKFTQLPRFEINEPQPQPQLVHKRNLSFDSYGAKERQIKAGRFTISVSPSESYFQDLRISEKHIDVSVHDLNSPRNFSSILPTVPEEDDANTQCSFVPIIETSKNEPTPKMSPTDKESKFVVSVNEAPPSPIRSRQQRASFVAISPESILKEENIPSMTRTATADGFTNVGSKFSVDVSLIVEDDQVQSMSVDAPLIKIEPEDPALVKKREMEKFYDDLLDF